MNINFRALFLASSGVLIAGPVMAQTRSSFLDTNSSSGITFNGTNGGLTVDVILGANPTFTVGANTYHVTSIIGFYALSDNNDLTVSNSDFGVWKTNNRNSGLGGIAGWKTNPNTPIVYVPGAKYQFGGPTRISCRYFRIVSRNKWKYRFH
jgi:hypothetical protein